MSDALAGLPAANDQNLLVGIETSDDAAVYRLNENQAMINTIDFITPPCDDPYWFGLIAAANSLSDVYSMGGKPLTALNVVMYPSKKLDIGILKRILEGGHDKVAEAGACLVGGHSVDDLEPKYGLCVNGLVHPDKIWRNSGARPGDALILTKPLGSGVLFNASRAKKLPFSTLEKEILPTVASLNAGAWQSALEYQIHACTDITGFGLSGHLLEVALGSQCCLEVDHRQVPFYPHAEEMYNKGETTGSNGPNRQITQGKIFFSTPLSKAQTELYYDPQTSGGLLFSLPEDQAKGLLSDIHATGNRFAAIIGRVVAGEPKVVIG